MNKIKIVTFDNEELFVSKQAIQLSPVLVDSIEETKLSQSDSDGSTCPLIILTNPYMTSFNLKRILEWMQHHEIPSKKVLITDTDGSMIPKLDEYDINFGDQIIEYPELLKNISIIADIFQLDDLLRCISLALRRKIQSHKIDLQSLLKKSNNDSNDKGKNKVTTNETLNEQLNESQMDAIQPDEID